MTKVTEVQVEAKTIKTETHNLINARGKFKVGQYIKFETIGKIVKATEWDRDKDLGVEVAVKKDYYVDTQVAPVTETKYQCGGCSAQFEHYLQAQDCCKKLQAKKKVTPKVVQKVTRKK